MKACKKVIACINSNEPLTDENSNCVSVEYSTVIVYTWNDRMGLFDACCKQMLIECIYNWYVFWRNTVDTGHVRLHASGAYSLFWWSDGT